MHNLSDALLARQHRLKLLNFEVQILTYNNFSLQALIVCLSSEKFHQLVVSPACPLPLGLCSDCCCPSPFSIVRHSRLVLCYSS
jgi:hypothetical protein